MLVNNKNPRLKSLKKIREYLLANKSPVTMTRISKDLVLSFGTVKACISFLSELGEIETMTNEHTTLIEAKRKEECQQQATLG